MNSHIISMRVKQSGVQLMYADETCSVCELDWLLTGDQSIISTQIHNPSTATHQTSRPTCEHSFSPFCHFQAAMNPSSCLPPTVVAATQQMALRNVYPFRLNVTFPHPVTKRCIAAPPWRWRRHGSVVGTGSSQREVTSCLRFSKINNGTKSKTKFIPRLWKLLIIPYIYIYIWLGDLFLHHHLYVTFLVLL